MVWNADEEDEEDTPYGTLSSMLSVGGGLTVEALRLAPAPERESEYVPGGFGDMRLVSGAKLAADAAAAATDAEAED